MGEVVNVNEIEARLDSVVHGDWFEFGRKNFSVGREVGRLGLVKLVEIKYQDEYDMQLQVVLDVAGRTFVKQGVWVSHDGAYWDGDFFEAHQVEKVVTVWDPVS